jgi:hypothetical protein
MKVNKNGIRIDGQIGRGYSSEYTSAYYQINDPQGNGCAIIQDVFKRVEKIKVKHQKKSLIVTIKIRTIGGINQNYKSNGKTKT